MSFFNETGQDRARKKYREWWVGKFCRLANTSREFKKVVDIETYGSQSFVTGGCRLVYEDGSKEMVSCDPMAYKPKKSNVEVKPELNTKELRVAVVGVVGTELGMAMAERMMNSETAKPEIIVIDDKKEVTHLDIGFLPPPTHHSSEFLIERFGELPSEPISGKRSRNKRREQERKDKKLKNKKHR